MILKRKRHLCLFAAAWLFGTVLYCRKEDVWLPVLLILGGILACCIASGNRPKEQIAVCAIVISLILASFSVCRHQESSYRLIQEMLKTDPGTELTGTVTGKQFKSDQYLYYLKTPYKKVAVYFETDAISIGSVVTVRGKWRAFSPASNEGSFDFAEDYREQNISFRVFADEIKVERAPFFKFREGLYQLQKRITRVFTESMDPKEAGVLARLTVGNRGFMDPDIQKMYQSAGISHILAISGLHISILGYGVYRFLRKIRVPCHICEGIGCGAVLCFVIMSGMGVSAVRALIMYILIMGARAFGRTYDPLNALALAMLVLLIPNPLTLYRSGFLFSFAAMAAIVLVDAVSANSSRKPDERPDTGMPGRFLSAVRGRILAAGFLQLTLLPLTAWFYFEVPLYATFLNLLILPLCSALLGFGLAGGLLGIFFPQAAKWLLIPCHFILRFYDESVTLVNRLPLSTWITGQPSARLILLFYVSLAGVCLLFLIPAKKKLPEKTVRISVTARKLFCICRAHVRLCSLLPAAVAAAILFIPGRQLCRIDFLDVGQGDGIHLSDGAGTHVMIDGGSSTEKSVGTYVIEPFLKYHAVRRVDAWILTHGDADHYSGLLELLWDGYPVTFLVLANAIPRDDTWEEITEAAYANGTEVVYVESGDGISLKDCEMLCLYPAEEDRAKSGPAATGSDGNEFSQVWRFEKDEMSVIFTGDLGEDEERLLIGRGELGDCLVLKAGHHGSKYSSCAEFLETVSPEYAVISCGENNIYGHPAPETLERLADAGCEVYQTPQCGQITFCEERGKWKLRTYLE